MCGFVDSVATPLLKRRIGWERVAATADERMEERGGARRMVVVHIANGEEMSSPLLEVVLKLDQIWRIPGKTFKPKFVAVRIAKAYLVRLLA
jgi:hypothetical protein